MATTKKYAGFRIEVELLDALKAIQEMEGITVPEQVRRAIRDWVQKKGEAIVKSDRKRVGPRSRS